MNTYIEANLAFLGGTTGANVLTAESTTSTTFTDLATVGPTVTVTTQTTAIVIVAAFIQPTGAFGAMSFAVSGASTIAASNNNALSVQTGIQTAYVAFLSGLTPGSNIFTAKYNQSGTTSTFSNRTIAVIVQPT